MPDQTQPAPATSATVRELREKADRIQHEFQQVLHDPHPRQSAIDNLQHTLQVAKNALAVCKTARSNAKAASLHQRVLMQSWWELQRRRYLLQHFKSSIESIERLRSVAQTVCDANQNRDYVRMKEACTLFESLNSLHPKQMDQIFTCIRDVPDRVAVAVAASMKALRVALRALFSNFDPVMYAKCMRDFRDLGAQTEFPHHVLQLFDEEAVEIYKVAIAREEKPCIKVTSFFSGLSYLILQFVSMVRFHRNLPAGFKTSDKDEDLYNSVGNLFRAHPLPYNRLGSLAVKFITALHAALINKQTKNLLCVFDASLRSCQDTIAGMPLTFHEGDEMARFRASRSVSNVGLGNGNGLVNKTVPLRRGRSQSDIGTKLRESSQNKSGRQIWLAGFDRPIIKAVHTLTLDCIHVIHARHREELSMITNSASSWIRMKMSRSEVQRMLSDLFHGIDGRIRACGRVGWAHESADNNSEYDALLADIDFESLTFSSISLSMLRWISEYVSIGFAVPTAVSQALTNVTDLVLALLQVSIDVESRAYIGPMAEQMLKSLENFLLQEPARKSIADFISPTFTNMFRAFQMRYVEQPPLHTDADTEKGPARWSCSTSLNLSPFSAISNRTSNDITLSREALERQCVAAESIGSICEILDKFSLYIDKKIQHHDKMSASYESHRMISLRAALSLGLELRSAFYKLLAWDVIGGWDAISAVAETCRSQYFKTDEAKASTATHASDFVYELIQRIKLACCCALPPPASERMRETMCEICMNILLEGFSRVQTCRDTAAISQMLVDLRTLDLELVEFSGLSPCPGRERTEMYIKAMFLEAGELDGWIDRYRRKLQLSELQVRTLINICQPAEIPIVDQIISP